MNEAENKVKQQIVEKIKSSTNILVTVSQNPTVDDLSAALGFTALLNKLDKHATAIFSGAIPPAISFLEPDKVFENTTDSLRDFIIALDKEKADHLRYKIEGDVVKIFVTPYRTTITSDDLEFSQGDYNVELVLALGVANQESLDTALAAHGLLLHDVTIATFSAGEKSSQLGSMDWRDEGASSLSEMVAVISDALKADKSLLDKQISTALLTGIVSATERFSNTRTTSRVMTIASQLMAAGADQQLIAAKLQESHAIDSLPSSTVSADSEKASSTELVIDHSDDELPAVEKPPVPEVPVELPVEKVVDVPIEQSPAKKVPTVQEIIAASNEAEAERQPETSPAPEPEPVPVPEPLPEPVGLPLPTPTTGETSGNSFPEMSSAKSDVMTEEPLDEPLLGGILNATSDQAAEDARRQLDEQQNKTILSHSYLSGSNQSTVAPINSVGQEENERSVDIFSDAPTSTLPPEIGAPTPPVTPSLGLPLPPPVPDFSAGVSASGLPNLNTPFSNAPVSDGVSTLAPSNDPSQFQIPS